jgi:hypothetical protein
MSTTKQNVDSMVKSIINYNGLLPCTHETHVDMKAIIDEFQSKINMLELENDRLKKENKMLHSKIADSSFKS